ncbi:Dihydrofolate synthase @ Folylpolyglutamate synthase [hydrothermal vent metagenome]|uniref:Dihydrofolate synthase @ Folylpolyglutamate synthase n=1 Tax=hydrothermal vent metagenome TaxID=652676 RepID=A0A3B0W3V5_9ZZZZ
MTIPNNQSSLECWIDWLLHLHPEEIDLGLDRIRVVAESMQLLRPAPIVISVAGTNGKGSSVAILVAILQAAGYRVGAYTSPHIQHFNERIQVNGKPVRDELIINAFAQIEAARGKIKLTYFEFATLAGLSVFKQFNLDVVVLEVGLGGRLDAVNVVDADAALITAIGIDHVEWLGRDRSVIATEKAGIMRSGKPAVCSDSAPPESLLAYAKTHSVPLLQLGRDFKLMVSATNWSIVPCLDAVNCWDKTVFKNLPPPRLKGEFQIRNAAGVVIILCILSKYLTVNKEAIYQGLMNVTHPGRLESFQYQGQSWLVDVAHNPQSSKALAEYLAEHRPSSQNGCYTAIFSALNDKDVLPMIQDMMPFVEDWLIADLRIPRAMPVEALVGALKSAGVPERHILVHDSIQEAVKIAQIRTEEAVLVWGSFFTVSQVYECLNENKRS